MATRSDEQLSFAVVGKTFPEQLTARQVRDALRATYPDALVFSFFSRQSKILLFGDETSPAVMTRKSRECNSLKSAHRVSEYMRQHPDFADSLHQVKHQSDIEPPPAKRQRQSGKELLDAVGLTNPKDTNGTFTQQSSSAVNSSGPHISSDLDVTSVTDSFATDDDFHTNDDAFIEERAVTFRPTASRTARKRITRALEQRMFLIASSDLHTSPPTRKYEVLGNTGYPFIVTISREVKCTCTDCQGDDVCKHIVFVMVRVLGLSQRNPLVWQKGLLTKELNEIFASAPDPTRHAHDMKDSDTFHVALDVLPGHGISQKPVSGDEDCPICYEKLLAEDALTWCTQCGNNFHQDCMDQYEHTRERLDLNVICCYCGARWRPLVEPQPPAMAALEEQKHPYMNFAYPPSIVDTDRAFPDPRFFRQPGWRRGYWHDEDYDDHY